MYDSRFSGLSPSEICHRSPPRLTSRTDSARRKFRGGEAVDHAAGAYLACDHRRGRRLALVFSLPCAPLPEALTRQEPLTTVYLDAKDRLIAEIPGPEARSNRPIPIAAMMGPWIRTVTVALEDRRFDSHSGVDFTATLRALVRHHGGGSTITQQLVKMATHRTGRSVASKLREMALALQLERRWTKEQILDEHTSIGFPTEIASSAVEAAARKAYFPETRPRNWSRVEAIYLAGIPRMPSRLNPWRHPEAAARQFRRSCGPQPWPHADFWTPRRIRTEEAPPLLPFPIFHLPYPPPPPPSRSHTLFHLPSSIFQILHRHHRGSAPTLFHFPSSIFRSTRHLPAECRPALHLNALRAAPNRAGLVRCTLGPGFAASRGANGRRTFCRPASRVSRAGLHGHH